MRVKPSFGKELYLTMKAVASIAKDLPSHAQELKAIKEQMEAIREYVTTLPIHSWKL